MPTTPRDSQDVIAGAGSPPELSRVPAPTPGADLLAVARMQRLLLWHVLALLVVTVTLCIAPVNAPVWTASVKLAAYFLVVMLTIAQAVRLSGALGRSRHITFAAAILVFIPFMGLVLVAGLNAQATALLRARGIRVGVMGAHAGELQKLRPGCCTGCGYDLRGLAGGRCPECGREGAPGGA